MFMDDDFGLAIAGTEAGADKIDFRFHHRHIVLRAALQYEARTKRGEIGNARDVEEYVFRQDCGEAGQDLFRAPALTLEIHDVGLHEDRATVTKYRHVGSEGEVGVFFHFQPKPSAVDCRK